MIGIPTFRSSVSGGRRVYHDSLHFAKLAFSAFAVSGFLVSVALFLTSTSGLLAVTVLAWSTLYLAIVFGLDERRRWGQVLAITILVFQPAVLATLTAPYWQFGALIGIAAMPLVGYLTQKKVTRSLY